MGRYPRPKQKYLGKKLLQVRKALGLSQNEMLRRLAVEKELTRTNISNYEIGHREPPLYLLLRYAELAGVCTDLLIDDRQNLPPKLPSKPKHKT